MSSRQNVCIKVTLQSYYCNIEEIKISKSLIEILQKDPKCGRSDYSDLPGAILSHGSGWRSRPDSSRIPRADPKKQKETQLRQRARREEITRRREEKRSKQRARQHERRRQEEMMKTFQESYKMPSVDSPIIISSSPMKVSPAKHRDDKDAFLYEKFKKNLSQEFKSESKLQDRVADGETLKQESVKTDEAQVSSRKCDGKKINEENDSAVTSSTQPWVTQKTAIASESPQDSKTKSKVCRAVPEIVDADSSTPHIVGRTTRKKQRICYQESPDEETEDEEYFFKSFTETEKEHAVKKKGKTKHVLKTKQYSQLDSSVQESSKEQSAKVASVPILRDNNNTNISQERSSQVPVLDFGKNDKVLHNATPNLGRPYADSFIINLDAPDSAERPSHAAKSPHSITSSSFLPGNFSRHHISETRTGGSQPIYYNRESDLALSSGLAHFSPVSNVEYTYQTPIKPSHSYFPASISMHTPSLQPSFTEFPYSALKSPIPNENVSFYPRSNLSPISRLEWPKNSQTDCPVPNYIGLSTHQHLMVKNPACVSQSSPRQIDSLQTFPGAQTLNNPLVSEAISNIPTSSYLQNNHHPSHNFLCAVTSAPTSQYHNVGMLSRQMDYQQAYTSLLDQKIRAALLSPKSLSAEQAMAQNNSMPTRSQFDAFRLQACNGMSTSPSHISSAELIHTRQPHYTVSAQDRMSSNSARIISTTSDSHVKGNASCTQDRMSSNSARIISTTSDSHVKVNASCTIIKSLLKRNTSPNAATLLELRKDNLQPEKRNFQNEPQRKEGGPINVADQSSSSGLKSCPNQTKCPIDGNRKDKSCASNKEPSSKRSTDNVYLGGILSNPFVSELRSSAGSRELQSTQISNALHSDNIDSHTSSADKAFNISSKNVTKQPNYAVSLGSPLSQVKQENPIDSLSLEQQSQTFRNPVSQCTGSSLHLPPEVKCLPAQLHLKTNAPNQKNCDKPVQEGNHPSSALHHSSVFHNDDRLNKCRPSWPVVTSLVHSDPGSEATGARAPKPHSINTTESGIFSKDVPLISQSSLPTSLPVQKTNSEMSQCRPISNLPQYIRSDVKLCKSQVAVIIAPPSSERVLLSPTSASHVPCSTGFDLEGHYTVTVSVPSANSTKSVEVEPDLSMVKSEDSSATVSLHLKEVIDLSADNEEMLLHRKNPNAIKLKDNSNNVISIIQKDQSEKVAKIVHKDHNEPISLTVHKDHSEKITGSKLKDHCEKLTYMHNESYRENGRSEMDSSNSHCQIDENSTIFSDILKQASPNKCNQNSSHVPVNPVPVIHQSPSDSSKSPTDSQVPHLSSGKAQLVIAKIKSWTKSEVHDWLKNHHMDKICPNLSGLDGEGLQRLALQYMHDSDSFYTGVKRRLGLSVFQTLVICRSMKELTDI